MAEATVASDPDGYLALFDLIKTHGVPVSSGALVATRPVSPGFLHQGRRADHRTRPGVDQPELPELILPEESIRSTEGSAGSGSKLVRLACCQPAAP